MAPEITAHWRKVLQEGRARLRQHYDESPQADELLIEHARLVDRVLCGVWHELELNEQATLVAVGGYGRGQLFPSSDVDILVLTPDHCSEGCQSHIETLIGLLWDLGLDVGHSVRTLHDCLAEARQDITVQTSVTEARFLTGNQALFDEFSQQVRHHLSVALFFDAKLLEQQQRHAKFHGTAHNLEPNVKESPGGLRDLHTILWVARAARLGNTWADLSRNGILTMDEARQLQRAELVLQNLRIALHYTAGRREDRLVFDFQTTLARRFRLKDTKRKLASEKLMQLYYRASKHIQQLNVILLQALRNRINPPTETVVIHINPRFHIVNGLLEIKKPDGFMTHPSALLEVFLLLQQQPDIQDIGAATVRALWHARDLINQEFRQDDQNKALFLKIFQESRGVIRVLRRMNSYGILGRYLPAFGRIVGQMQHDLYHVYTVDEHILMVVRNLRRFSIQEFSHEYPLCSRLMLDFERPEILYLAALFHDIAKGRGGDHSQLGKVDAARFGKNHGLRQDDTDLMAWLVEQHLVMSSTAQKQDVTDPEVIERFAGLVQTERRLVALYLLTVADVRGTSPKVWNGWKAKLLEDLFLRTRRKLRGADFNADTYLQTRQDSALAKTRLYGLQPDAHEALWAQFDSLYFMRHDTPEIAWHTRNLFFRSDAEQPVVKARLSPSGAGLQVMVYTRDQPALFARICSFFERSGYSIADAKIYTTKHGYALDTFLVFMPDSGDSTYRDLINYVEHELATAIRHESPLEEPSNSRLSRQLRYFPIHPEINIRADERDTFYVMSLVAGDRPGLLYRIARTLHQHGINVRSAKIATLGERAEDTFLITGASLNDPRKMMQFERDLLHALQTTPSPAAA